MHVHEDEDILLPFSKFQWDQTEVQDIIFRELNKLHL